MTRVQLLFIIADLQRCVVVKLAPPPAQSLYSRSLVPIGCWVDCKQCISETRTLKQWLASTAALFWHEVSSALTEMRYLPWFFFSLLLYLQQMLYLQLFNSVTKTRKMAQLIKYLTFKHEYLGLDPSIHIKQLGMTVPSSNPVLRW